MASSQNNQPGHDDYRLPWYAWGASFALIIVTLALVIARIGIGVYNSADQEITDDLIIQRADDAITSVELVLSFLEGAAVLIGLGFGALVFIGIRATRDVRAEMKAELAEIKQLSQEVQANLKEVNTVRQVVETYRETLERLPQNLEESRQLKADNEKAIQNLQAGIEKANLDLKAENQKVIDDLQANFNDLLQAVQELNLKNYDEAYRMVRQALRRSPENTQALYIAGWLEMQYIAGELDNGIAHLHKAMTLDPDSPSMKAAYGVALRRKALRLQGKERTDLLTQSEGYLKIALGINKTLLDLNRESFWGPIGGTLRDTGRIDDAIIAYHEALKVTPSSSYPVGNLANLYLRKASEHNLPEHLEEAIRFFRRTTEFAITELSFIPKDYYPMMDLAMAFTMLGQQDRQNFERSDEWLENALGLDYSPEMLRVSLGGWHSLSQYCPPEWGEVKSRLINTIERLETLLKNRPSEPLG